MDVPLNCVEPDRLSGKAGRVTREQLITSLMINEVQAKMTAWPSNWPYCLISPKGIAEVADLILDGTINRSLSRRLIDIMWDEAEGRLMTILRDMLHGVA